MEPSPFGKGQGEGDRWQTKSVSRPYLSLLLDLFFGQAGLGGNRGIVEDVEQVSGDFQ